jgi:hypothetical protein
LWEPSNIHDVACGLVAAVIAKRFEELQAEEVDALLSDLEDQPAPGGPAPPKIRGSGWRPDQQ